MSAKLSLKINLKYDGDDEEEFNRKS